jgi:Fic family protein
VTICYLEELIEGRSARGRALPGGRLESRHRTLLLREIAGSAALAGIAYPAAELRALAERGTIAARTRLADALAVAGLADAVRRAGGVRGRAAGVTLVTVEEILDLHRRIVGPLASVGASDPGGTWRREGRPPFPSGMVPSPPWLIPKLMGELAGRLRAPTEGSRIVWIARVHARFMRIRPFADANGRAGRLLVNLLLRRLGYPPWTPGADDAARYAASLARADGGEVEALALLIARGVAANAVSLYAEGETELVPLAALVSGAEYAALRKAAERDRLDHVRIDGHLLTTRDWIGRYYSGRSAAGRRTHG